MDALAHLDGEIATAKRLGRYRTYLNLERRADLASRAIWHSGEGDREIVVWCSNDYLAMSGHPAVVGAVTEAVRTVGLGTGGPRSISGTSVYHHALEAELASFHGKPRALLFSTGFGANEAALSVLGKKLPGLVVFSDELNHASIIQGIKGGGARKRIFRHNDVGHLRRLLAEHGPEVPKLVVFESLYSMEGDFSPTAEIVEAAEEAGALTYLDEVHTVGVYGATGSGYAEELGLRDRITVIMAGFGKGLGGSGGYITGPEAVVDAVRSFATSFVFSTSLAAPVVAGALASVRQVRRDPAQREAVRARSAQLKAALHERRIPLVSADSHVVPVLVGDPHLCKRVSERLLAEHGYYVQPVNAPTVPEGTERLRVTPTSRHTPDDVTAFVDALDQVWSDLALPRA
ncbi:5-aminolevulinate synthase [Spongiactinospora rosea]|uniref:8-amino-7-oxononanoate synthase n=1 Tax=Spongiactinospora rosea TaxID=2248750 RepID=A0A366LSD6_9ACTN|nr:5-aminolevulinate synthase [Spongiactinospora rosea]RBQ16828.1 5-aminolevulinate synthase [Spongiactinospora rosea]